MKVQSDNSTETIEVCVHGAGEYETQARKIAADFNLPGPDAESNARYVLEVRADGVFLTERTTRKFRPISMKLNRLNQVSRKNPLGRALGKNSNLVIDGTAGYGDDALLIARMGYQTVAMERVPALCVLLENAIERAKQFVPNLDIRLVCGDAKDELPELQPVPEVVYLDPMYPPGRKTSVKTTRRINVLRDIAGDDDNAEALLQIALKVCSKRSVVKRPKFAPPMMPDRLSCQFNGKMVRYDVYQV